MPRPAPQPPAGYIIDATRHVPKWGKNMNYLDVLISRDSLPAAARGKWPLIALKDPSYFNLSRMRSAGIPVVHIIPGADVPRVPFKISVKEHRSSLVMWIESADLVRLSPYTAEFAAAMKSNGSLRTWPETAHDTTLTAPGDCFYPIRIRHAFRGETIAEEPMQNEAILAQVGRDLETAQTAAELTLLEKLTAYQKGTSDEKPEGPRDWISRSRGIAGDDGPTDYEDVLSAYGMSTCPPGTDSNCGSSEYVSAASDIRAFISEPASSVMSGRSGGTGRASQGGQVHSSIPPLSTRSVLSSGQSVRSGSRGWELVEEQQRPPLASDDSDGDGLCSHNVIERAWSGVVEEHYQDALTDPGSTAAEEDEGGTQDGPFNGPGWDRVRAAQQMSGIQDEQTVHLANEFVEVTHAPVYVALFFVEANDNDLNEAVAHFMEVNPGWGAVQVSRRTLDQRSA